MSSLFNSTLLVYWDNILVDLAEDLNTTEFLSSYRCISPKIFEFSLINKTFRLNWENFVPIKRSLSQLTEIFSINLYRDDLVPGEVSQLSGVNCISISIVESNYKWYILCIKFIINYTKNRMHFYFIHGPFPIIVSSPYTLHDWFYELPLTTIFILFYSILVSYHFGCIRILGQ